MSPTKHVFIYDPNAFFSSKLCFRIFVESEAAEIWIVIKKLKQMFRPERYFPEGAEAQLFIERSLVTTFLIYP